MDKVIVINDSDPYVLLNHLKTPISKIIEGDIEHAEPVIFYNDKSKETYVINYLYVNKEEGAKTKGLKTLSILIDPSNIILFPRGKHLTMLQFAIKSKRLLSNLTNLNTLKIIDQLSMEFEEATEIMLTVSHPVYSISRVWDSKNAIGSDLLFDQIFDFLKIIFTYQTNGLYKAIDIFTAFCLDTLVLSKRISPSIKNKIIIFSQDLPEHPIVRGFDLILTGQESLYPIILLNYSHLHYEAFVPSYLDSHNPQSISDLPIGDISILLSRLFHNRIVYELSFQIGNILQSLVYRKQAETHITKIETTNVEESLRNLLVEKYGIIEINK